MTSIIIPDSVTGIGSYAFSGCSSLTDITMPSNISYFGNNVFNDCSSLNEINLPNGITAINPSTFFGCSNLSSITIPDTVTSIGASAFEGCKNLVDIIIPDSVTSISYGAFSECSSLQSITLPKNLAELDQYVFQNCKSLKEIIIPDGLWRIWRYAFSGCSSLQSITIPNSVTEIMNSIFEGCTSLSNIILPPNITSIPEDTFKGCSSLAKIFLPETVSYLGYGAFSECSSLKEIALPQQIETINYYAFNGCTSLKTINIPYGVTEINDYAFSNCSSLLSVIIPGSVEYIGKNAFSGCSSLSEVSLPEGILYIKDYSFSDCKSLSSIQFPDSLKSIGNYAFSGCSSLSSVRIPDNLESMGKKSFENSVSTKIYAELGSDAATVISKAGFSFRIPYHDDYGLKYLFTENTISGLELSYVDLDKTMIEVVPGVTRIAESAFKNCTLLKQVSIPNTVTSIGSLAFSGCSTLSSITIPASVGEIANNAFNLCNNLSNVCFLHSAEDNLVISSYGINKSCRIYCYEFSNAEVWFTDNGYSVTLLDGLDLNSNRSILLQSDCRIPMGEQYSIAYNIFPSHDNPMVEWNSNNNSIATVKDGIVTPHKTGSVIISASSGSVIDYLTLEIYTPAKSFELDTTEEWLIAKDSIKLNIVNIQPFDAEAIITWSCSDTLYASVDSEGFVTTKKPGIVMIYADSDNGIHRECKLNICYRISSVEFDLPEISIIQYETFQAKAIVTTANQTIENRLVTFESSNPEIATVDVHGVIRGIKPGNTIITASADGVDPAYMRVIVRDAYVLNLPAGLASIDSEAFEGVACEVVIIPSSCTSIGERAFANCKNLIRVILPHDHIDISDSAFDDCNEKLIIEK